MTLQFPPPASFSSVPGCPPSSCFDPAALLGCYSDVQALTVLIKQIVQNLAATDPAFQQSLVDAIVKSGSNIPLIGVTNGSDAQPGQVGEFVEFLANQAFPVTAQTITLTMGVLQPGDWDVWTYVLSSVVIADIQIIMTPTPAGFNTVLEALAAPLAAPLEVATLWGGPVRGSLSVPTLIPMQLTTNNTGNGPAPGNATILTMCRRVR